MALTAAQVERGARATAEVLGLGDDDRWLSARFEAGGDCRGLAGDVDLVSLVPTMLARVFDAGLQHPRRLRAVVLGGAGAPRALAVNAAR